MTDAARFEARVTRAVRKYRRELIARDKAAQSLFARQLRDAHQALLRELETARKNVESARDRGVNENTFRLQRALAMAKMAEELLHQYAQNGTAHIAQQQREVAGTAYQAAQEFLDTTNPPPPGLPNASSFMTFPQAALETITAATTAGPVSELLNRYGADAAKSAGRILTQAIVLGTHSDVIGRQLSNALAVPLWKGAQIARTEINRAYQESLRETWRENKEIVPKWIWRSGRTASTCAVCWAMDGTEHDVEEPMGSHPSCRCSMVPASISWNDLAKEFGIEMPPGDYDTPRERTGPEAFAQLSPTDQRAVLGPGKFKAYRDGEIRLEDLVQESRSDDWGLSRREGSLKRAKRLAASGRNSGGSRGGIPRGPNSSGNSGGSDGPESGRFEEKFGRSVQGGNGSRGGRGDESEPEEIERHPLYPYITRKRGRAWEEHHVSVETWEVRGERKVLPPEISEILGARSQIGRVDVGTVTKQRVRKHRGEVAQWDDFDAVISQWEHFRKQAPDPARPDQNERWQFLQMIGDRSSPEERWPLLTVLERLPDGTIKVITSHRRRPTFPRTFLNLPGVQKREE